MGVETSAQDMLHRYFTGMPGSSPDVKFLLFALLFLKIIVIHTLLIGTELSIYYIFIPLTCPKIIVPSSFLKCQRYIICGCRNYVSGNTIRYKSKYEQGYVYLGGFMREVVPCFTQQFLDFPQLVASTTVIMTSCCLFFLCQALS